MNLPSANPCGLPAALPRPDQDSQAIRVFIAAPLDAAARERLAEAQDDMRRTGADVKWVAPLNIHLTLVFLGDLFASLAAPLGREIAQCAERHRPCSLEIRGLDYFGAPAAPRVVWAGLRGDLGPLLSLQSDLVAGLKAAGLSPDTRHPFHPHLTLGRTRSGRGGRELDAWIRSRSDLAFGQLAINEVLLVQSRLQPQGPVYATLHASRLGPPAGT